MKPSKFAMFASGVVVLACSEPMTIGAKPQPLFNCAVSGDCYGSRDLVIGLPPGEPDYPADAAGTDPNGSQDGLWLGPEVTPERCFKDLNPSASNLSGFPV